MMAEFDGPPRNYKILYGRRIPLHCKARNNGNEGPEAAGKIGLRNPYFSHMTIMFYVLTCIRSILAE